MTNPNELNPALREAREKIAARRGEAEELTDALLKQLPDLAEMARAAEGVELSDAQVMELFNATINGLLWFAQRPELLGEHDKWHSKSYHKAAGFLMLRRDAYAKRIAGED